MEIFKQKNMKYNYTIQIYKNRTSIIKFDEFFLIIWYKLINKFSFGIMIVVFVEFIKIQGNYLKKL